MLRSLIPILFLTSIQSYGNSQSKAVGIVYKENSYGALVSVKFQRSYTVDLARFDKCEVQNVEIAVFGNDSSFAFGGRLQGDDQIYNFEMGSEYVNESWLTISCVPGTEETVDTYHLKFRDWVEDA